MIFDIYQGEKIIVSSPGYTLQGELQNSVKYHVKLFEGEKLILDWSLATILFSRKVNIQFQDLPTPISELKHIGLWSFAVEYGSNVMVVKLRPFRKAYYQIHLNGGKVADVYFTKKFTAGYRQFTLKTNTDNQTQNLYIIIAFLLQLIPV